MLPTTPQHPVQETAPPSTETNQQFLERHARAGLVCLSGGPHIVDVGICRAQRHLNEDKQWSKWSHVFLLQGQRVDGHHWIVESDFVPGRKHMRLGVQENRLSKYYDQAAYTRFAILDFDLSPTQRDQVLARALEMVAAQTQYSLRELLGALIGLRNPTLRQRENLLSQSSSYFCSAFVAHLFRHAGLDIAPGLPEKHTTPEDVFRSMAPHKLTVYERE